MTELHSHLRELASQRGLSYFGDSALEYPKALARFSNWMALGKQGGLSYLERHRDLREKPSNLLAGAKSVHVFGLPYYDGDLDPSFEVSRIDHPRVAQYARFPDYHKSFREELIEIFESLLLQLQNSFYYRVLVDTAPVLERALASQTGVGFIGKNTCYIHPEQGSFFLLGEVLTTLAIGSENKSELDSTVRTASGGCGTCHRCQIKCPTGALDTAFTLDARLCLSYWTIEHRGPIPEKFWPYLKYYWFGCDICQLVCPYNLISPLPGRPKQYATRPLPSLFEVATMDQSKYEKFFGGTPLTRAKRNGLRRNALIAMFVTQNARLSEAIESARTDLESPIAETLEQMRLYSSPGSVL